MTDFKNIYQIFGRILLSIIFLKSGIGKIGGFAYTSAHMASKGMPFADYFLIGAIAFLIIGSISIILGYKAKWGAALLVVFLIPTTLIFHSFWALEGTEAKIQTIMFMKNIAIIGGLLGIIAHGSGAYSLDNILLRTTRPTLGADTA